SIGPGGAGALGRPWLLALILRRFPCPERLACSRISRDDRPAWAEGEIDHALHHDRGHFGIRVAEIVEFPAPRNLKVLDVVFVDWIERRVIRAARLARIGAPLAVFRALLRDRGQNP